MLRQGCQQAGEGRLDIKRAGAVGEPEHRNPRWRARIMHEWVGEVEVTGDEDATLGAAHLEDPIVWRDGLYECRGVAIHGGPQPHDGGCRPRYSLDGVSSTPWSHEKGHADQCGKFLESPGLLIAYAVDEEIHRGGCGWLEHRAGCFNGNYK